MSCLLSSSDPEERNRSGGKELATFLDACIEGKLQQDAVC
jgi:hypothetical protein